MPWYTNQTLTTFIAKTDLLNHFHQSLVTKCFDVKNFLAAPIVPINLATCAVIELFCDWLCDGQIKHIGLCIWCRVLLHPSRASVCPPFLHQSPSKNEVPPVPIHPNKSTQHRLRSVYRPSKNPLISPQLWNYMLNRYIIRNFRVAVLIIPMKRSPCFHNSSSAGTDEKYESAQTILSVLSHGIISSFRNFVP